jgi:hypothetical protein
MKIALVTVAAAGLAIFSSFKSGADQAAQQRSTPGARFDRADLLPLTVDTLPVAPIEGKQNLWRDMQKSLPPREREALEPSAALEMMKQQYEKNLIVRFDLDAGHADFAGFALGEPPTIEESVRQKSERRARSARRAARPFLMRYEGGASWTIDDVESIDAFFRERFGRPLPVSALGQSITHDRLGLDHSEAVDVAVRPDSAEGRALMAHLRAAGIPFIAFRGKITRMSTGPHIHIGPPSPRLLLAKRDSGEQGRESESEEQS